MGEVTASDVAASDVTLKKLINKRIRKIFMYMKGGEKFGLISSPEVRFGL